MTHEQDAWERALARFDWEGFLGIDLSVDSSWLIVFVLVTWNLTVVFREWHPTWGVANLVVAITAALLFFGSIVAHELSHALVALSFGMRVRGIRLFLFGGVSDIEQEPPSPRAEAWMAVVGPLASIAIGGACLMLAALILRVTSDSTNTLDAVRSLGPVTTLLVWLGPVNITVGLFDLVPGFPLDGGRILRAALWAITHDLRKATRLASNVGRFIGATLIALGLAMTFGAHVPFFGHGIASGLWLVFIGWFLRSAAASSYVGLLVDESLAGVRVEQLMRRSGWTIPASTSIADAVSGWFLHSHEHAYPVFDGHTFVGLVSLHDAERVSPRSWDELPATAIMTPASELVTANPDEDVSSALRKLASTRVEQLPVVSSNGTLVGMLERATILRFIEAKNIADRQGGGFGRPAANMT